MRLKTSKSPEFFCFSAWPCFPCLSNCDSETAPLTKEKDERTEREGVWAFGIPRFDPIIQPWCSACVGFPHSWIELTTLDWREKSTLLNVKYLPEWPQQKTVHLHTYSNLQLRLLYTQVVKMHIYIYKMRYDVRMKLMDILDAGDFWRELGGRRLNYTPEVRKSNRANG